MKTSAPRRASASVPETRRGFVSRARASLVAVEALAPGVQRAAPVADDDVPRAEGEQHPGYGRARRAGAVQDYAAVREAAAREAQRVFERG